MNAVLCAIYEALTKKIPGSVPVERLAALNSAPKGGNPSVVAAIAELRVGKHWEEIGWQGEDPATDHSTKHIKTSQCVACLEALILRLNFVEQKANFVS